MFKARRFEEADWYGFAGAVRFPDNSEPFICEVNFDEGIPDGSHSFIVIGSPENISVFTCDADGMTTEHICHAKNAPMDPDAVEYVVNLIANVPPHRLPLILALDFQAI